jgi:hypothetical protein
MIGDMQLHHFSQSTQKSYEVSVFKLAKYYRISPDKISEDKLKEYILYLINERGLKWSSINTITLRTTFFL